jgi:osmotically-inducible protein OsmY
LRSLLASDKSIPTQNINVTVAGGVATLRGSVPSLFARDRALELAQSMRGIERVENLLAVAGPARGDDAILRDVNAALAGDPVAGPLRIGVAVNGGEVTLTGNVDRWQTQEHVTSLVKGIPGVRGITSRLAFSTTSQPDDQIVAEVQRRLSEDKSIDPGLVQVGVKNGTVTLNGTVSSTFERNRAITDAWVEGVTGVSADDLRVDVASRGEMTRPAQAQQVSDQDIRGALSNAFAFSPRLLSFNPEIQVRNGVVTLSGEVDSPQAKQQAQETATGIYGVRSVNNQLVVRNGGAAADTGNTPSQVTKFREAINRDPQLKTFQLSSSVADDGFYVYGIVDTEAKKARAEKLAASIPGVDNVVSKIRVSENWQVTDSGMRPSDDQIKQATMTALAWSPYIDPGAISVTVRNGIVTLDGSVNSWRDSNMAVRAARLSGATEVQNNLRVGVTADEEARQVAAGTATGAGGTATGQNVAAGAAGTVPGAAGAPMRGAGGAAATAVRVPTSGIDVAYDNGLGVAVVPGSAFGTGVNNNQTNGTGLGQGTTSTQPENVPINGMTTPNGTNATGVTGVPGAAGSDPNVAAVPGSAGLTAPGADQVSQKSSSVPGLNPNTPATVPTTTTPVPPQTVPAPGTPANMNNASTNNTAAIAGTNNIPSAGTTASTGVTTTPTPGAATGAGAAGAGRGASGGGGAAGGGGGAAGGGGGGGGK